jgi:hypothetical protein
MSKQVALQVYDEWRNAQENQAKLNPVHDILLVAEARGAVGAYAHVFYLLTQCWPDAFTDREAVEAAL